MRPIPGSGGRSCSGDVWGGDEMPGAYSENAITAKVKAMYGKRLTPEDYNQLLQKKSVGEIAAYLKHETVYGGVLREIKEDLIHRGQLENLVRRHAVEIYSKLLGYSFRDRFFPTIYTARKEIEQLLSAMRMLNSGSMNRFILDFPPYLDKYMSFDLFSLARIASFDDLLEVVQGSEYYRLLGPHRPVSAAGQIDIMACETTLLISYYRKAFKLLDRYDAGTREDLAAILRVQIDLHNLTVIYRLKRFYNDSKEGIVPHLIPIKTRISHRIYSNLVDAPDTAAMYKGLEGIRMLRRYFKKDTTEDIGYVIECLRQHTSRKIFRFSNRPVVAVLSYMTLMEMEEDNVVNIIEGIRYALPPDEIRKLLILS